MHAVLLALVHPPAHATRCLSPVPDIAYRTRNASSNRVGRYRSFQVKYFAASRPSNNLAMRRMTEASSLLGSPRVRFRCVFSKPSRMASMRFCRCLRTTYWSAVRKTKITRQASVCLVASSCMKSIPQKCRRGSVPPRRSSWYVASTSWIWHKYVLGSGVGQTLETATAESGEVTGFAAVADTSSHRAGHTTSHCCSTAQPRASPSDCPRGHAPAGIDITHDVSAVNLAPNMLVKNVLEWDQGTLTTV